MLPANFWTKIDKNGPVPTYRSDLGPRWVWLAGKDQNGYGRFNWLGRLRKAHTLAYEEVIGPIPDGLVPDHLCRFPGCVNPAHLEPVTNRENVRRGLRPEQLRARYAVQTHCSKGHEFTPENTYYATRGYSPNLHRQCRKCQALRQKAYRERLSTCGKAVCCANP